MPQAVYFANGTPVFGAQAPGKLVQIVNTQTSAVQTSSTAIPLDDTLPQNTEGTQFLSLAITPTNTASTLRIDIAVFSTVAVANKWSIFALFQDSGTNALAVGSAFQTTSTAGQGVAFSYYMTAGTTSATTFKLRGGANDTSTLTLNGQSSARLFGGAVLSSLTITEYAP